MQTKIPCILIASVKDRILVQQILVLLISCWNTKSMFTCTMPKAFVKTTHYRND